MSEQVYYETYGVSLYAPLLCLLQAYLAHCSIYTCCGLFSRYMPNVLMAGPTGKSGASVSETAIASVYLDKRTMNDTEKYGKEGSHEAFEIRHAGEFRQHFGVFQMVIQSTCCAKR